MCDRQIMTNDRLSSKHCKQADQSRMLSQPACQDPILGVATVKINSVGHGEC